NAGTDGTGSSETIQQFTNAADATPMSSIAATGLATVDDGSTNTGQAVINVQIAGTTTVGTPAGANQFAGTTAPSTTFLDPATSLTVNLNAAGTLNLDPLGAAFNPTGGVQLNGSTGSDAINVTGTGANPLATLAIVSGSQTGDAVTFTGNNAITGLLTATSGGSIAISSGTTTAANINFTAGTSIGGAGALATVGTLTTQSASGTNLTGSNAVATFNAQNSTTGPIVLDNTAALLTITSIVQNGDAATGSVSVNNSGSIANTGAVTANGGAIGLTATGGTLTIAAGVQTKNAGAINLSATGGTNGVLVQAGVSTGSGPIAASAAGAI